MAQNDLAALITQLLTARVNAGGVTEFREGPDTASFESIDSLVKALGRTSSDDVQAALGNVASPGFTSPYDC